MSSTKENKMESKKYKFPSKIFKKSLLHFMKKLNPKIAGILGSQKSFTNKNTDKSLLILLSCRFHFHWSQMVVLWSWVIDRPLIKDYEWIICFWQKIWTQESSRNNFMATGHFTIQLRIGMKWKTKRANFVAIRNLKIKFTQSLSLTSMIWLMFSTWVKIK